jgi:hypothetical protein
MELTFCSSSIPRTGDKEEEQAPEEEASSLPALPAAAAYSALPWRQALSSSDGGGAPGGDDDVEMVDLEKEHMFDKVLTPSDVGKLNRVVIPKQHAESYFPLRGRRPKSSCSGWKIGPASAGASASPTGAAASHTS